MATLRVSHATDQEVTVITKFSLVCQVPGAPPYHVRAYTGGDLSQVLAISLCQDMPDGCYGWLQEKGEVAVMVDGQVQAAYADFGPNAARVQLSAESPIHTSPQPHELPEGAMDEAAQSAERYKRQAKLPPLLIEAGPYCKLLVEARDTFVDGHFYACVAMCGIAFERFQRDKAKPHGGRPEHKMRQIRRILCKGDLLQQCTLDICEKMAELRNVYAHGDGQNPKNDALQALGWMHTFIQNETDLMRGYEVVNGQLLRK